MRKNFATSITQWATITGQPVDISYVIYAGNQLFTGDGAHFVPWNNLEELKLF